MPIHDWTRVDAGLFHNFHRGWICAICDALNSGGLPPDHFALIEKEVRSPIPDLLNLVLSPGPEVRIHHDGLLDVANAPPRAHMIQQHEADAYAGKANRVVVRQRDGDVVAVIVIVSPGNKASRAQLSAFAQKSAEFLRQGIHLLVIDLFPPSRHDAQGIHKAIWDVFEEVELKLPADKPLTLASYDAGPPYVAYIEPVAVGDALPHMPLFLRSEVYVSVPLEATYQTTWNDFPGR